MLKNKSSFLRNAPILPHQLFFILSIVIGFAYIFITPPFRSHDEYGHYMRVIGYSKGKIWQEYEINKSYVDFLIKGSSFRPRIGFNGQYNYDIMKSILDAGNDDIAKNELVKYQNNLGTVDLYSPVAYIPTIISSYIFQSLHTPPFVLFYLLRIISLLSSTLLIAYAIKKLPYAQWSICAVMLWPMAMCGRSMVSADSLTIGFILLFVSFLLRTNLSPNNENKVFSCKYYLITSSLAIAIALSKIVYFTSLTLLFIPNIIRKSSKQVAIIISTIFIISFSVGMVWNMEAVKILQAAIERSNSLDPQIKEAEQIRLSKYNFIKNDETDQMIHSSPKQQMLLLRTQPMRAAKILYNTFTNKSFWADDVFFQAIGGLTESKIPVNKTSSIIAMFVAFLLLFTRTPIEEDNDKYGLLLLMRIRILLVCVTIVTFFLTLLALHIQWNPLTNNYINGFQGRYMLPLMPLMLIAFYPPPTQFLIKIHPYFSFLKAFRNHIHLCPSLLLIITTIISNYYGLSILSKYFFGGFAPFYNEISKFF